MRNYEQEYFELVGIIDGSHLNTPKGNLLSLKSENAELKEKADYRRQLLQAKDQLSKCEKHIDTIVFKNNEYLKIMAGYRDQLKRRNMLVRDLRAKVDYYKKIVEGEASDKPY